MWMLWKYLIHCIVQERYKKGKMCIIKNRLLADLGWTCNGEAMVIQGYAEMY